jgi:hypothetical protein
LFQQADLSPTGFNSFADGVRLKAFELPSDNPAGGINFRAVTELNNTSPFSLNLGTVVFDLFFQGLVLGRGTGKDTIIVRHPHPISRFWD